MVGWLSLPKGWKRKGEWPVLVAVDGAGSNFLGAARGFAQSRGARDFLVLAPCSLSNTNALEPVKYPFYSKETLDEGGRDRIGFDLAGLDGLLAVLKERFGASDRIGITGFSGGGNLCYGWLARHPDRTRFAIPACANFSGLGFQAAQPVEGGGPPIRIVTGANDEHREFTFGKKDSPGIEPQTDRAVEALGRLGFTKLERRMLPGVGHSSCHAQVWEFADEVGK
jgi:poly(3-hydroxybutyrate) depolymerase